MKIIAIIAASLTCACFSYFGLANILDPNTSLLVFTITLASCTLFFCFVNTLALLATIPVLLLLPYYSFYSLFGGLNTLVILAITVSAVGLCHNELTRNSRNPTPLSLIHGLCLMAYLAFFSTIVLLRYDNFQSHEAFDIAISSQIQWNTVHGRLLESSVSGSNFVTHNSPFLILLTPFYALFPSPKTLLFLKSLFLTMAAVPFFHIARLYLNQRASLWLTASFLLFPHIVGQHFNAPHESTFMTPLLLSCLYYFLTKHFGKFIFFALLCLSIKEHLALIIIMFAVVAFIEKRKTHWIYVPFILGLLWTGLSLWIIHTAQQHFSTDPLPAWLIKNISERFSQPDLSTIDNITHGIKTSTFGNPQQLLVGYQFLAPLLFILPFSSVLFILGLPELLINLLSSYSLMHPTWHYMIAASCFFLSASIQSISAISNRLNNINPSISNNQWQNILAITVCCATLIHFPTWWQFTTLHRDEKYVQAAHQAITLIPANASVSLPSKLAAFACNRKDYFLPADQRKGTYVIIDNGEPVSSILNDDQVSHYTEIFNQYDIRVLKRR